MADDAWKRASGIRLVQFGLVLFLFGLVTGFVVPAAANPRMGLSSHMQGLTNGMFLAIMGLVWPWLAASRGLLRVSAVLLVFGAYANWATTLAAALWGAGGAMMPIAAGGFEGAPWQEAAIAFGLLSLSAAVIAGVALALWSLRVRAAA